MLMCRDHWFALPKPLRDTIWESFRGHQWTIYREAVAEAKDYIDRFERPFDFDAEVRSPRAIDVATGKPVRYTSGRLL